MRRWLFVLSLLPLSIGIGAIVGLPGALVSVSREAGVVLVSGVIGAWLWFVLYSLRSSRFTLSEKIGGLCIFAGVGCLFAFIYHGTLAWQQWLTWVALWLLLGIFLVALGALLLRRHFGP